MIRKLLVMLFSLVLLALTACSAAPTEQGMVVEDAWVRPAPMLGGNGAGYLVITNNTGQADTLLGADADFAAMVEVHESVALEGDMITMQRVDRLDIPAGESVALEPGSYHVMLMGFTEQLREGDSATLTLIFENAGEVTVEAPVREQ